jgi:hypothetical protein
VHVYPNGVRADSFWLDGFTRRGVDVFTLVNPMIRMYSQVPMAEVPAVVARFAEGNEMQNVGPDRIEKPVAGKVGTLAAKRYRFVYERDGTIDFWMTNAIPENAELRTLVDGLITGISKPTAKAMRTLRGTPVYVELNYREHRKVNLLTVKRLTFNNAGESSALKLGSYYFRAPLLDAIWR